MAVHTIGGSAPEQGRLWSERAGDWAAIQEDTLTPVFERVLEDLSPVAGKSWLDVGCGTGKLAALAVERQATVVGLDAAPAMVEIAQQRAPAATIRLGEMEQLPFSDSAFDIVTGFNSFQYASRPVHALSEARRVARPGALVVTVIWGTAAECDAADYLRALGLLQPPAPRGAPGPFALSEPGALESLVAEAGLKPVHRDVTDSPWVYPNLVTALRGLLAGGPAIRAIEHSGEKRVLDAVAESISAFRRSDGSYRLQNKFQHLVAIA